LASYERSVKYRKLVEKENNVLRLLMKDRLNTGNLLRRKTMFLEDYNYVLCNTSTEETLQHLFLNCPFAKDMWSTLGLDSRSSVDPMQVLEAFRGQLNVPFFMEIITSMSWAIWSVRNDAIFRNYAPTIQAGKRHFKTEFATVILREKMLINHRLNYG
jgi:hypothetical protein